MMLAIECPKGNIFSACVKEYADEEWKAEELYYQQQGCTIKEVESVQLSECGCENIKHEFIPKSLTD